MKKLREYLIKWTDGQRVRGINVTPYDVKLNDGKILKKLDAIKAGSSK